MPSDADVTCGQCGRVLNVDPATNANAEVEREPCPYCGARSRGITIKLGAGNFAFEGASALTIEANLTASGTVGNGVPDVQVGTSNILGHEVAHRCQLVICKPSDDGATLAAVLNDHGDVITFGYCDSVDDALPDLMLSMLPPDHPDFDSGPRE